MNLKYTYNINYAAIPVTYEYYEPIPKIIEELYKNAIVNESDTIREYIEGQLYKNSHLYDITIHLFKTFESVLDESILSDIVKETFKNGYIKRHVTKKVYVDSGQPLYQEVVCSFHNQSFKVENNIIDIKRIESIIRSMYPNSVGVKINKFNEYIEDIEFEQMETTLNLKNDGNHLLYKGYQVDHHVIDFDIMYELNSLSYDESIINSSVNNFSDYDLLTIRTKETHSTKAIKLKEDNDKVLLYSVNVNDITIYEYRNINNIPVFNKYDISTDQFVKSNEVYDQIVFEINQGNQPILNQAMFVKLLKEEKELGVKLLKSKEMNKYLGNSDILRRILLNDFIEKVPFDIKKDRITQILIEASNVQLPSMLKKLTKSTRDSLSNTKLISKICNVDRTLLNESQLRTHDDLVLKKQLMYDEYINLFGQIVATAIREKIRDVTNKDFDKLKINKKHIKKWLDNEIGHNKVTTTIDNVDQQKISSAKRILTESNRIIEYLNKNPKNNNKGNINKKKETTNKTNNSNKNNNKKSNKKKKKKNK